MRSYIRKLENERYHVTTYKLMKNKGVQVVQYTTDDIYNAKNKDNATEEEEFITEEDLLPTFKSTTDRFDVYKIVCNKDRYTMDIPCYMAITIFKVKLRIGSSLGNRATLSFYTNKFLLFTFNLYEGETELAPGDYEFEFTWDSIDTDMAAITTAAEFREDGHSIDALQADAILHDEFLYVKIFDTDLNEYKLVPIVINTDTALDDEGNVLPLALRVQINGMDDAGLAQLTVGTFPIDYNVNSFNPDVNTDDGSTDDDPEETPSEETPEENP